MVFRGMGYISVSSVTAAIGSALTAGHFRKAGMPAQPKVTNQRVLATTPDTSVMLGVPKIKIKTRVRMSKVYLICGERQDPGSLTRSEMWEGRCDDSTCPR